MLYFNQSFPTYVWYAKRRRSFAEHHFDRLMSFSENVRNS